MGYQSHAVINGVGNRAAGPDLPAGVGVRGAWALSENAGVTLECAPLAQSTGHTVEGRCHRHWPALVPESSCILRKSTRSSELAIIHTAAGGAGGESRRDDLMCREGG